MKILTHFENILILTEISKSLILTHDFLKMKTGSKIIIEYHGYSK